jgi:REP element-mobilizing transposase RayT
MARRLRIQYPGAIYHVINRGNYRRDLFTSPGEAQAFLATVKEAKERMGWHVHAYVLMRNHYHLAIETPEPNLVQGMHWLQTTWSSRFNRFRSESGHLFQGRYRALDRKWRGAREGGRLHPSQSRSREDRAGRAGQELPLE